MRVFVQALIRPNFDSALNLYKINVVTNIGLKLK